MIQELMFTPYTVQNIKPSGWYKRQLEIQAEGLSGHLDQIWPDIYESGFLGGKREAMERLPYWLDGFIPLAYLLEREDLIARAKKYMDTILNNQEEDGWICPCKPEERLRYDLWGVILVGKVLVVYAECSGDERVENALYGVLKNMDAYLEIKPIYDWGKARWFEALIAIYWLYERRPEQWLIELAHKLKRQGHDYRDMFDNWKFSAPNDQTVWTHETHVVNISMALKGEGLYSRVTGEDANAFSKKALGLLQQYHGMPTGHYSGDECLAGTRPIQGSELCGVVEAMYSYEHLLAVTGDVYWADMLERTALNALPAAISPDMWSHQYDQMTNQVQCTPMPEGHVTFLTNSGVSHRFGFDPNYGCCTANFNQGWPKLAFATFMRCADGIASQAFVPTILQTEVKGVQVRCELQTLYPFRDTLMYIIETDHPVEFDFVLRIPEFASAQVEDQIISAGRYHTIHRVWNGKAEITVRLLPQWEFLNRPNDMHCVRRGALLFSVPIEEQWNRIEYTREDMDIKFPYCDYDVLPQSAWNYGFAGTEFRLNEREDFGGFFDSSQPPLEIYAQLAPIDWGFEYGYCKEVPDSRTPLEPAREVRMIPYGCAHLRMTEMPLIRE